MIDDISLGENISWQRNRLVLDNIYAARAYACPEREVPPVDYHVQIDGVSPQVRLVVGGVAADHLIVVIVYDIKCIFN